MPDTNFFITALICAIIICVSLLTNYVYKIVVEFRMAMDFCKNGLGDEKLHRNGFKGLFPALKNRSRIIRNLYARGIRKHRQYVVSQARITAKEFYVKFYEDNPTAYTSIDQIKAGDWIMFLSTQYPYKGDGYSDYCINNKGGGEYSPQEGNAYKVYHVLEDSRHELLVYGDEDWLFCEVSMYQCRPANRNEINNAFYRISSYLDQKMREVIDKAQREVIELENEHENLLKKLKS